jgi:short-subunit dehydrogenase
VTRAEDVERMFGEIQAVSPHIDAFVHAVGQSSRCAILDTTVEAFQAMMEVNFLSAVRCSRLAVPRLLETRGHLVLVGSLAAKAAGRFLGAYPATKFALAAYAQQLRLELSAHGLHVLLVCPGPIEREDAGRRYDDAVADLPEQARQPGAGVKLRAINANQLAERVWRACERRRPELIVPTKARWLFAISQLFPAWGDWILLKHS